MAYEVEISVLAFTCHRIFQECFPNANKNSQERPEIGKLCYKQALCHWEHFKCKSGHKIKT